MVLASVCAHDSDRRYGRFAWALAALLSVQVAFAQEQQAKKIDVLRIGTSGTLALDSAGVSEDTAMDALRSFVKSETGFDNEILPEEDYRELGDKLASGQVNLGVFQGYEFAWTRGKDPKFEPLAIAINGYTYRYAYVAAQRDNKATDFAGLLGQSLALPRVGQGQLRLFVERQSQANGKQLETFFSKITTPDNIEDALDDVVDGVVQAAVVDRVGLDAYKRRKPGRFSRLKVVARSQAFPPPVVAYYDAKLDKTTLQRFEDGLLNARRKEKGQRLLNLFKLTGFEKVPKDFDRVLVQTREAYPPPNNGAK